MKKTLISLITIISLGFQINAQTEKGKLLLTGTLGYSSKIENKSTIGYDRFGPYTYYYEEKNTEFSIVPKFGAFLADNFALGSGIGYSVKTSASLALGNSTTNALVVNPYSRYYVSLNEKFKFFGELGVALNYGTVNIDQYSSHRNSNSREVNAYLSPGFAFFPTNKVSVELSFTGINYRDFSAPSFSSNPNNNSNSSEWNIFSSSAGSGNGFLNPKLGVSFYF